MEVKSQESELASIADSLQKLVTILGAGFQIDQIPGEPSLGLDIESDELDLGSEEMENELDRLGESKLAQTIAKHLRAAKLIARDGPGGPDGIEVRESRAAARRRELEAQRQRAIAAFYAETTKLAEAMGLRAFRSMMVKSAQNSGMPRSQINHMRSVASVGDAVNAFFMVSEFIAACREVHEAYRERERFNRRQVELERAYFRGMDRNQMEVERVERIMNTA